MTLFTKTKLGVALLLLFPCLSFAQNEPFWIEDFSDLTGASLPPAWTTNDASMNVVETLWQSCGSPDDCPPNTITDSFIRDNFRSSTAANGYVFSYSAENENLPERWTVVIGTSVRFILMYLIMMLRFLKKRRMPISFL